MKTIIKLQEGKYVQKQSYPIAYYARNNIYIDARHLPFFNYYT
jgi:hypothetical protein